MSIRSSAILLINHQPDVAFNNKVNGPSYIIIVWNWPGLQANREMYLCGLPRSSPSRYNNEVALTSIQANIIIFIIDLPASTPCRLTRVSDFQQRIRRATKYKSWTESQISSTKANFSFCDHTTQRSKDNNLHCSCRIQFQALSQACSSGWYYTFQMSGSDVAVHNADSIGCRRSSMSIRPCIVAHIAREWSFVWRRNGYELPWNLVLVPL